MKKLLKRVLLVISIITLLTSCHSEYLNLEIKTDGTIAWNKDSSAFAFVVEKRLYRMPKGIAKIPDGGKTKSEDLDFSVYKYDLKTKKLSRLTDLNEFFIANTYQWSSIDEILLSLNDTTLYYRMQYPNDWDLKKIREERPEILTNIVKTYKINLKTLQKDVVDTTVFKHLFGKKREKFKPSLAEQYFANLKCDDWGIDIQKIYPQSKDTYIDYIVEKRGNPKFRECIFQQIVPGFSREDTQLIVNGMKQHLKDLYEDYKTTDKIKDVYQKHLKKDRYVTYMEYREKICKLLKVPSQKDTIADQKHIVKQLEKIGISLPKDFRFSKAIIFGDGYEADFELINADTVKIEQYKKWFRDQVSNMRKNNWKLSELYNYKKLDDEGIGVTDKINFIWEHTELQKEEQKQIHFVELAIDYGVKYNDKSKFLSFSVTEEYN